MESGKEDKDAQGTFLIQSRCNGECDKDAEGTFLIQSRFHSDCSAKSKLVKWVRS